MGSLTLPAVGIAGPSFRGGCTDIGDRKPALQQSPQLVTHCGLWCGIAQSCLVGKVSMRQRRQEVRPKGECGRDCGRSERTASAKGNRRRRPSHPMPRVSAAPSPSPLCRHRRCPHAESTGLRRCAERSSSTHAAYTSTLFARKSGRTRASTHKQTHARMHAHTNTRTHACTHTHTQTHARRILVSTQRRSSLCCWFQALRIESLLCSKARSV